MSQNSIIGPNGQLVLPLSVRRALGLRAGDRVAFQVGADGSVTLHAARGGTERPSDRVAAARHLSAESAQSLAEALGREAVSQAARGLAALRGGTAEPLPRDG